MAKVLNCNDSLALDLLSKMIVFNPEKRLSVEECLSHQYVTSIKESSIVDPVYQGNLDFSFEKQENIDVPTLIALLEKEILTFETGISFSIA